MDNKRGQVAIFVIIAIVIVTVVIGIFILSKFSIVNQSVPVAIQPVYDYVDDCFKDSVEEGLFLIGLQGGSISSSQESLQTNLSMVSFVFYNGKSNLLSKQEIEKELGDYVISKIENCIEDEGLDPSFDVSYAQISPKVEISDFEVDFSLSAPLSIKKEDHSYNLDKTYNVKQIIRLGDLHSITEEVVQQLSIDSSSLDLTYLTSLDYQVDITDYGGQQFLYTFVDLNNTLGGEPYFYRFAVKL